MSYGFESLEQRRFLSVSIAGHVVEHIALNSHGTLVVTGTGHSDHISIKAVGARLRVAVDDGVAYYTSTRVKSISIAGGNGNDSIAANTADDETIIGGNGDDSISSGSGDDSVEGDAGDDSILSGGGDDNCHGGLGDDDIDGGSGTNNLTGDDGDDSLSIHGDSHGSHLSGGLGDDQIETNDDRSTIVDAGQGSDHVHGKFHGTGSGIEFDDDHPDSNGGGGDHGGGDN